MSALDDFCAGELLRLFAAMSQAECARVAVEMLWQEQRSHVSQCANLIAENDRLKNELRRVRLDLADARSGERL